MPRKRVLIITFYWPPSGGPGVQRWLKFVKYMRDFGWEPVIYTPENPELQYTDESLLKDIPEGIEVLKTRITEPLAIAKKVFNKKAEVNLGSFSSTTKLSFSQKLMLWARANVFIPDPRVTWVRPSIRYLEAYLSKNPVDAIVSTSTPQSMHLIAMALKRKFGIKWLADFRDPWTKMHFFEELPLTKWSLNRHKKLEEAVLKEADIITVVGKNMGELFNEIEPRKYEVVTNGFDDDDYKDMLPWQLDKRFSITHIGTLLATANHSALWQALKELCDTETGFKDNLQLKFVGQVHPSIFESIRELGMGDNLEFEPYKKHSEIFELQRSAQVLLLTVARTRFPKLIITGKIFEYLAARRPILGVVPTDGDAADIIVGANAGHVADFDNKEGIKTIVREFYLQYVAGELFLGNHNLERYSRRSLTQKICALLTNA